MKKGTKTARTALVLLIMAVTVMLLYHHMVNKVRGTQVPETVSAVQNVLLVKLESSYPATPREVVKFYNEIMQCYYNEEYSEEEFEQLAGKAWQMYDEELIAKQDWDSFLASLKAEIESYKEKDIVISSAAPASSTDVDYYTYEGRECANIRCAYTLREKTSLSVVKEIYVLRKDDQGHWKILGWELMEDDDEDD